MVIQDWYCFGISGPEDAEKSENTAIKISE